MPALSLPMPASVASSWGAERLPWPDRLRTVADLNRMQADELHHPLLLIHSRDDEFVPVGPSERLAAARPDLVTFEPWSLARHCKEWNVDPHRWDRVVGDFVR